MRLCRFNDDRLGLAEDEAIFDVTAALEQLPPVRWPHPHGDALIANLATLRPAIRVARASGRRHDRDRVRLLSPVANPSKIIAAPLNYRKHVEEAAASRDIHHGTHVPDFDGFATPIDKLGLFVKASSSLAGPDEGVRLAFPGRRNDHELELVAVIGAQCRDVAARDAKRFIAGYAIGLDMTVRGPEDRSWRKSLDTFSVLGPWLATADEIADPAALALTLHVGGELRQSGSTRDLLVGIDELVARASCAFTLYPGDLLYTGTPEGVSEVRRGDIMHCRIDAIGAMSVPVL